MKKYSKELNYFNAFACIGVILVHVLSIGITSLNRDSIQLFIIFMPWKIAAYVVPAFLFSGAVKMALSFDSEKTENYFKYIAKRFLKIYLPYCLWVVVYYLYFLKLGWVEKGIMPLIKYILVGDLSAQFYYVVIVMQFYILMPLWKLLVKHVPFFIGVPFAGLITVFMLKFDPLIWQLGINFPYRSIMFVTYLVFWVIGLYTGKHYEDIKNALKSSGFSVVLSVVTVILITVIHHWQYAKGVYVFDGDVLKFFTDILTVFVMLYICITIENSCFKKIKKFLSFIHKSSFSVYLSHCLVLQIVTNYLTGKGVADIGILLGIRAVACYTIPFFLWHVWSIAKNKVLKITNSNMQKAIK